MMSTRSLSSGHRAAPRMLAAMCMTAIGLTACAGSESGDPDEEPTATDAAGTAEDGTEATTAAEPPDDCPAPEDISGEVVFGGVGGTPETIFLETLIPKFEAEYPGVTVTHVTGRPAEHYQLIEADPSGAGFDVVWMDLFTHEQGKAAGAFLENECMPNEEQLYEQYLDPDGVGLRTNLAATGLAYNREALEDAGAPVPTAWEDLWDSAYEGKVGIWAIPGSVGTLSLVAGIEVWGNSLNDPAPAVEKYAELVEQGATVFETPAELEELMTSEAIWVAPSSDARTYQAIEKGLPLEFVVPEEGMVPIYNYFDIPEGAPNVDAARAWANFVIREDNLIHLVEGIFVSPVNSQISLSPDLSEKLVDTPEEVAALIQPDLAELTTLLGDWTELFNRNIVG